MALKVYFSDTGWKLGVPYIFAQKGEEAASWYLGESYIYYPAQDRTVEYPGTDKYLTSDVCKYGSAYSPSYKESNNAYAWKAFNSSPSQSWQPAESASVNSNPYIIYNYMDSVKINKIKLSFTSTSYIPTSFNLYGSNDNIAHTDSGTFQLIGEYIWDSSSKEMIFNVSSDNYFEAIKIVFTTAKDIRLCGVNVIGKSRVSYSASTFEDDYTKVNAQNTSCSSVDSGSTSVSIQYLFEDNTSHYWRSAAGDTNPYVQVQLDDKYYLWALLHRNSQRTSTSSGVTKFRIYISNDNGNTWYTYFDVNNISVSSITPEILTPYECNALKFVPLEKSGTGNKWTMDYLKFLLYKKDMNPDVPRWQPAKEIYE